MQSIGLQTLIRKISVDATQYHLIHFVLEINCTVDVK
jgi:hypothetical protein